MQIANSSPIAAPVAANANTSNGAAAAPGENSPFAKLLSAQKTPVQSEGNKPAERGSADAASDNEVDEPKAARMNGSRRAAGRAASRADAPREAARGAKDDALALAEVKAEAAMSADTQADESAAHAADESPITDPAIADWLAGLNRPVMPTPAADTATGRVPADVASGSYAVPAQALPLPAAASSTRAVAGQAGARADKAGERATECPAIASDVQDIARDAAANDALVAAAADKSQGEHRIELPKPFELPSTPAAAGVQGAQRSEAGTVGAPSVVSVPTPTTSPEFREALGVQVSVLARDGVQRAELHLNPAEMGPISVQIALDGARAQVDFGAESFATRQIIEAGLPELAAALRDAGFTLAGGGVSQHARGQSEDGAQGGDQGKKHRGDEADGQAARLVTARVSRGAVDLYA